jgi:hypothetical protein
MKRPGFDDGRWASDSDFHCCIQVYERVDRRRFHRARRQHLLCHPYTQQVGVINVGDAGEHRCDQPRWLASMNDLVPAGVQR